MKKQIKALEILGILAGPAVGYFVGRALSNFLFDTFMKGTEGWVGILLSLLFAGLAPAFVSVLAAGCFQSRRYRPINVGLATFVVAVNLIFVAFRLSRSIPGFVTWSLDVALSMSAALAAIHLWKKADGILAARFPGKAGVREGPLEKVPQPSLFLTILAILSIPVTLVNVLESTFITIGISAALLLFLSELPRLPLILLFGAALAPLAAIWATATAIVAIVRPAKSEQAAVALDEEAQPGLAALVRDVAAKVGTPPPDRIILHAQPTFFVTRSAMKLLDGEASGRILALGMPILKGLSTRELQAVLAHEFAHFAGNDVLYSNVVAPAYRSLGVSFEVLAKTEVSGSTGAVMSYLRLPSLLFLAASHDYFATIDRMLSRGRELRADRVASTLYGKAALVSSLEKASVQGQLFDQLVGASPLEDPASLFAEIEGLLAANPSVKEAALSAIRDQRETALDSHPSLATRAESLPESSGSEPAAPDWDLSSLAGEERRLSILAVRRFNLPLASEVEEEEKEPAAGAGL